MDKKTRALLVATLATTSVLYTGGGLLAADLTEDQQAVYDAVVAKFGKDITELQGWTRDLYIKSEAMPTPGTGKGVALGKDSIAKSESAVAIGNGANASEEEYANIAIGSAAQALGGSTVAIGSGAQSMTGGAVAIGTNVTLTDENSHGSTNSIGIGHSIHSNGIRSILIGEDIGKTDTPNEYGYMVGIGYQVNPNRDSVAIGSYSSTKESGVAIGAGSHALADNGVAIGFTSFSASPNSVALGHNSYAYTDKVAAKSYLSNEDFSAENGVVAIGNNFELNLGDEKAPINHRRITGVAGGADEYDAVNVKQLIALSTDVDTRIANKMSTISGSGVEYIDISSNEDGNKDNSGATGTDSIAIGPNATAQSTNTVAIGSKVTAATDNAIVIGSNITDGNGVVIGVSSAATSDHSIAIGVEADASGSARNTAVGWKSKATGDYSVAYGQNSQALGESSVALGTSVTANGKAGIAIGNAAVSNTKTKTESSIAIGDRATAESNAGVAIGIRTTGSGDRSTALGFFATSSGKYATALGANTEATASSSVAIGSSAKAEAERSVAIGSSSVADRVAGTFGYSPETGTFADEGEVIVYLGKVDEYNELTTKALAKQEEMLQKKAAADANPKDKALSKAAVQARNELYAILDERDQLSRAYKAGLGAVSVGNDLKTRQITNVAAGTEDTDAVNVAQLKALNNKVEKVAEGPSGYVHVNTTGQDLEPVKRNFGLYNAPAGAGAPDSVAIGSEVTVSKGALRGVAIGRLTNVANEDGIAIGHGTNSIGDRSVALGFNSTAGNTDAVVIGPRSSASGLNSLAVGNNNTSAAAFSYTFGQGNETTGQLGLAMGYGNKAKGLQSIAIGAVSETSELGENALAIGTMAKALGNSTIALGSLTSSGGDHSVTLGFSSITAASAVNGTALGRNTYIGAVRDTDPEVGIPDNSVVVVDSDKVVPEGKEQMNSIAIGHAAKSFGYQALSVGNGAETYDTNTIAIGVHAKAKDHYATAIGKQAYAEGEHAIALGHWTRTTGENSIAIGTNSIIRSLDGTSDVNRSVTLGSYSRAASDNSIALGSNSLAYIADDVKTKSYLSDETFAKEDGVVSVGNAEYTIGDTTVEGNRRRITNVAGGADDYDAVNVKQLKALNLSIVGDNKVEDVPVEGKINLATQQLAINGDGNIATTVDKDGQSVKLALSKTVIDKLGAVKYLSVNSTTTGANSNEDNLGAKGTDSIAIGPKAITNSLGAISIGKDATTAQDSMAAMAIGYEANATGIAATAIGAQAKAFSDSATAVGFDAVIQNASNKSGRTGSNAVAIGVSSKIDGGNGGIAIGNNANVIDTNQATVVGTGAMVSELPTNTGDSIVITDGSKGTKTITKGEDGEYTVESTKDNKDALKKRNGEAYGATALGSRATAHNLGAVAAGLYATAIGDTSVAIGNNSMTLADSATAVGASAIATAEDSLALGGYTNASIDTGVALGAYAKTDRAAGEKYGYVPGVEGDALETFKTENKDSVVWNSNLGAISIGVDGKKTRQITNVAAGTDDTDAVNVAQLKMLRETGLNFKGDSTDVLHRRLSEQLNIIGGANVSELTNGNIGVVASGTDTLTVKLAKNLALADGSVAFDEVATDADGNPLVKGQDGNWYIDLTDAVYDENTKSYTKDNAALTPVETPNVGTVKLSATGLDNGNQRITNVAAGIADTDAVTVAQLKSNKTHYFAVNSTDNGEGSNYNNDAAIGKNSMAIGANAGVAKYNENSIALGYNAKVNGSAKNTVVIGPNSNVNGTISGVVVGSNNAVNQSTGSVVVGSDSEIDNATASVIIGQSISTVGKANWSTIIANDTTVTESEKAISIGKSGEVTNSKDSIKIGTNSKVIDSQNGIALGFNAFVTEAKNGIGMGYDSRVNAQSGIALGTVSKVTVTEGVALGAGSLADTRARSGYNPLTNKEFASSSEAIAAEVGKTATLDSLKQKLVAAQADKTAKKAVSDAAKAEYNQDRTAEKKAAADKAWDEYIEAGKKITSIEQDIKAVTSPYQSSTGAVSVGKAGLTRQITNVAAGTDDTDAVNVAQLKMLRETGLNFKGDSTDVLHRGLSEQLNINGGANASELTNGNIGVVASGTDTLTVKLAKNIKLDDGSVEFAETAVDTDGNPLVKGQDNKWYTKDGVAVENPIMGKVKLSSTGLDNGNQRITNVAKGTADTDAVNYGQLMKEIGKAESTVGSNHTELKVDGTSAVKDKYVGEGNLQLGLTEDNGKKVYDLKLNSNVTIGTPGKDGKPGEPGTQGEAGSIGIVGLVGEDSKNGIVKISVKPGTPGVDGKNGETITRIVYETGEKDDNGNPIVTEVATLNDGMKFAGDDSTKYVAKKLNEQLDIKGGAAADALSDNNIGVVADVDPKDLSKVTGLRVKLAKNLALADGSVAFDEAATDDAGNKLVKGQDGNWYTDLTDAVYDETTKSYTKDNAALAPVETPNVGTVKLSSTGLDNGNQRITNVAAGTANTDAVNYGQLMKEIGKAESTVGSNHTELKVDGTSAVKDKYVGEGNLQLGLTEDNGKKVYDLKLNSNVTIGTPGKDGKPGEPGTQGEAGSIGIVGLVGEDSKNGIVKISVKPGTPGVDGKDGETITRIVYETGEKDANGNSIVTEVATLNDGMKFAGDDSTKYVAKKLNEQLDIKGGAAADALSDNNIGVVADVDPKTSEITGLRVKLAKDINLPDGSVRIGGTTDEEGNPVGGLYIAKQKPTPKVAGEDAPDKAVEGLYITGLDNTDWNPDTTGIVETRAATEKQLLAVANTSARIDASNLTDDNVASWKDKLGIDDTVLGEAGAWKLQVNGAGERSIKKNSIINFKDGSKIKVAQSGNDITIGVDPDFVKEVSENTKNITDLTTRVTNVEGDITTIGGKVTNLEKTVNNITDNGIVTKVEGDADTGVKVTPVDEADATKGVKVSLDEKSQWAVLLSMV